jgi:phosphoribosylformimino-5-aminoimidazole carboxamide ribonucleotide (ProFAR) isomerase
MRVAARIASAVALTASIVSAGAAPANILRMDGLGPVTLGMTVRGAERALKAHLHNENPELDDNCTYYALRSTQDSLVHYMVEHGRITRIDIDYVASLRRHTYSPITTATGIGIGSTETDIRRAYGRNLKIVPDPYMEDQGNNLTVEDRGHNRGILFETAHGRVTSIRAGVHPALEYSEGCS